MPLDILLLLIACLLYLAMALFILMIGKENHNE